MSNLNHELSTLAGAYALDALDEQERAAFEAHLATCADCAAEVRSLRAAAAELSRTSTTTAPEELRGNVLAAIENIRPLPPSVGNVVSFRAHAARRWLWQAVAAACVLLAATAGAWGYQQHHDANRSHARTAAITSVLDSRDAASVAGAVATGHARIIYSKAEHRLVLIGQDIPEPARDRTYQLWMIDAAGHASSGGVFTPNSSGHVLVLASGNLADVARMGISIEPAGGSRQPTPGAIIAEMPL
ncbi:MAG: anti-sigma factor [Sciscionella sp.]